MFLSSAHYGLNPRTSRCSSLFPRREANAKGNAGKLRCTGVMPASLSRITPPRFLSSFVPTFLATFLATFSAICNGFNDNFGDIFGDIFDDIFDDSFDDFFDDFF